MHGFLGLAGDTAIDQDALLADALGITTDELQAARVKAQDLALAQAVTDGQITQEQADQMKAEQALKTYLSDQGLQTQMQTLYQDAVKQAVKAGVITQAQADAILANQGKFGGMHGFDGFGGRGGMHGSRRYARPRCSWHHSSQQHNAIGLVPGRRHLRFEVCSRWVIDKSNPGSSFLVK